MHNLGTVFKFEFIRTIKKPTFWISVLAFPIIFGVLAGIIYFSGKAADEANRAADNEKFSISIVDESGLIGDKALQEFDGKRLESKQAGILAVKSGDVDAFFYYPHNPSEQQIEIHAKDVGLTKNSRYNSAATNLLQISIATSIGSPDKIALLQGSASANSTTYTNGEMAGGYQEVIAPGIFLVLFYVIIVLLAGQMLASTTEEKENRVIEMILTTIHARTLIIGKILAILALGLLQIAIIVLPIVIAYLLLKDSFNIPALDLTQLIFEPLPMLLGALFFIGGFMLFTGMLVAIGAAVPTIKEANSFFGVVILMMFIPFYAAATIVADASQPIVKILSFFPVTAPITLMLRNAVGNLSITEATIGLAVIFVSGFIALAIAIRAFRYGTVEYNRRLSIGEIFRLRG